MSAKVVSKNRALVRGTFWGDLKGLDDKELRSVFGNKKVYLKEYLKKLLQIDRKNRGKMTTA